jgi:very-short-patch-repair endonuclease
MDAVSAITRLGGTAGWNDLLDLTTRRRLRTALAAGSVVRSHRGRYVLPDADRARRAGARVNGVLALRSAAMHHGWPVKFPPQIPEVAVPRKRRVTPRKGVRLVWLSDLDTTLPATPPLQTVLTCARLLPFDEALAIADSALRLGDVTTIELREAADLARGAGAAAIRRVARHATAKAANPFESVLRALALEVGLDPRPQHPVDVGERVLHPDLVAGRLVLEADSWEWHTGKQAHVNDCWRYNALVLHGWTVLRFSWEHVMLQADYVRAVLRQAVQGPPPQAEPAPRGSAAA